MHIKPIFLIALFSLAFSPSTQTLVDHATVQNGLNRVLTSLHRALDQQDIENLDLPDVAEDINHIITTIIRVENNLNRNRKHALNTTSFLPKPAALLQVRFNRFYLNTIIYSCIDDVFLCAQKEKLPEAFIETLNALINYESCYTYGNENNQAAYHQPFLYPFALFFLQVLNYVQEEAPKSDTLEGYLETLHHRITLIIGHESSHKEYSSPLGNTHITSIKKLLVAYVGPLKREETQSITQSTSHVINSIANLSQDDLQKTLGASYDTLIEKEPGIHRLVSNTSNVAAFVVPATVAAGGSLIIVGCGYGVYSLVTSISN